MYTNIKIKDVIVQASIGQTLSFLNLVETISLLEANDWIVKILLTIRDIDPLEVIDGLANVRIYSYNLTAEVIGNLVIPSKIEEDCPTISVNNITVCVRPKNKKLPQSKDDLVEVINTYIGVI